MQQFHHQDQHRATVAKVMNRRQLNRLAHCGLQGASADEDAAKQFARTVMSAPIHEDD